MKKKKSRKPALETQIEIQHLSNFSVVIENKQFVKFLFTKNFFDVSCLVEVVVEQMTINHHHQCKLLDLFVVFLRFEAPNKNHKIPKKIYKIFHILVLKMKRMRVIGVPLFEVLQLFVCFYY